MCGANDAPLPFHLRIQILPMHFPAPAARLSRPLSRQLLPIAITLALCVPATALADVEDNTAVRTLDRLEVQGQRIERAAFQGNMDRVRTENDAQPYTIINRARIERSGATSIEDLLRQQYHEYRLCLQRWQRGRV